MRSHSTRLAIGLTLALISRAVPGFALCGDGDVDVPAEQCDVTAQAGEAACPGACIPPGVAGACTCAAPATSVKQYAAIANSRMRIGTSASVLFGGIAVTQEGGSLVIGRRTFMASSSQAVADRVRVAGDAQLGRLFANLAAISPSATLSNGGPFRFATPLVITGLQPFPTATPGSTDITVPDDTSLAITPAAYGRVIVGQGATLTLAGFSSGSGAGIFHFAALRLDNEARLTAVNPVIIAVAGRVGVGSAAFFGPANFAAAIAGDVQLNVGGASVRVKQGGTLVAHLVAPRGRLSLGRGAIATGLLVGEALSAAGNVLITRQGGCGDGMLDAGEQCDTSTAGGDAACPGDCIAGDPQGQGRIAFGQRGQCSCRCTSNADCNDNNACNGSESCDAGVCTRTLPPSCDDGNPCTRDCDPAIGCVNTPAPNGTSCDDDNACTTQDTCQAGACAGGAARVCDDLNSCTTDGCNTATGCVHAVLDNGTPCSDGNACTLSDICLNGLCASGQAPNCFDNNPCTDDTCDPRAGCTHAPLAAGAPCSDANACTAPDGCQNGFCTGPPANCDDSDPCTAESCDAVTGCHHTTLPNGTTCGPGLVCFGGSCQ